MPLSGSLRPFGLRDIKITPISGGSQIDLPAAMTLSFKETTISGEMRGDDTTVALVAFSDKVEWEIEAGGISMEAYAIVTGRTIVASGTTPAQVNKLTAVAGDDYPYFKLYGQSIGDTGGDIHVLLPKCKVMEGIEGEFTDGEFFVTGIKGVAVSDGTKLYEIVQNETATAVPAT